MCGIVGIINQEREVASDLYTALLQMQHRGKEGAGIAVSQQEKIVCQRGTGEVPQVFTSRQLEDCKGRVGLGHLRYGTAGATSSENLQPIKGVFQGQDFYLVHNGNLVNTEELKAMVTVQYDASDTRTVADLVSESQAPTFEQAILETLVKLQGAFNFIFLFGEHIFAVKDAFGFHPMQLGRRGNDFFVASESCVFDHLGGELVRDIDPGEMLVIGKKGVTSYIWTTNTKLAFDILEFIYLLRPDSVIHKVEAGMARYWMGKALAKEHALDADMVVPIADSGNEAALGYWEGLDKKDQIQFRPWALFRPHTVSRTFIEPIQELRERGVRIKFNPRPAQLKGKSIVLVDDSLIRANTLPKVVQLVRKAGAQKVSAVISSPMYRYPDVYGIDTGRVAQELIASREQENIDAIKEACGLDYLGYLNMESTVQAVLKAGETTGSDLKEGDFYTGHFTGMYPAGQGKLFD